MAAADSAAIDDAAPVAVNQRLSKSKQRYPLLSSHYYVDRNTVKRAVSFISNLRKSFSASDTPQLYTSILNVLNSYRVGTKTLLEVDRDVSNLLLHDPYLLYQFHEFVGRNNDECPSTSRASSDVSVTRKRKHSDRNTVEGERVQLEKGMILFKKVEEALSNSDKFLVFLKLFHCYNNERIDNTELRDMMWELLGNCPNMLKEVLAYVEDCGSNLDVSLDCVVRKKAVLEGKDNDRNKKQRCELEEDVGMDSKKTNGGSSQLRQKSSYEELMFHCEDHRFEMDLLIKSAKKSIRFATEWLDKIEANMPFEKTPPVRFFSIIERMYDDWGLQMVDILHKDPSLALPIIIPRLEQKREEWRSCRSDFDKYWSNVRTKHHQREIT